MAEHFCSFTGTSGWALSTNRATPSPWWEVNTNAAAGDIVTFINDGGDFNVTSGSPINPTNSGTAGNPITFRGEASTTVVIRSTRVCAQLANK